METGRVEVRLQGLEVAEVGAHGVLAAPLLQAQVPGEGLAHVLLDDHAPHSDDFEVSMQ